jgi:hypothetical protein
MADEFILNQNPRTYEEKYEGTKELSTLLFHRFNDLKHEVKVMMPCRVTEVDNINNQVSVEILDYTHDETGNIQSYPIITNIPIRQPMDSGVAYIRLPVQIGDEGTIEFFDSSVDDLIVSGVHSYDLDEDWHKINDNLFTNGFLSKNKLFTFDSEAKIVLGGKDGVATFKLTSDNTWTMVGNLNVTGTITATVDVIGGGKHLKTHTHPYTDNGNPMTTSAPNS